MKKKNLIILLFIPFFIALLGVVTINTTFSFIDNDLLGIKWKYNDMEGFKLSDTPYKLEAEGINQKNYPAGKGNGLVWSVRNKDKSDSEVHAEIVGQFPNFYLKTISKGEVVITCSNEKGNISKSMNAVIYDNGAILINPVIKLSDSGTESPIYYGQYDLKDNKKVQAEIAFQITTLPDILKEEIKVENVTSNISFDLNAGIVKIIGKGKASFTIGCSDKEKAESSTFDFNIVENGINVYTYNDLLYCTNKSEEGEIVVLRKSFESLDNAYQFTTTGKVFTVNGVPQTVENNVECFGNYDVENEKFTFEDEIYSFETTYNSQYIDQWNKHVTSIGKKRTISKDIFVGLRVQKDFYGNGYSINVHNLAYPTGSKTITVGDKTVKIADYTQNDIFKGPLPFYTLGDHTNEPLVEAYGQDNIGMYIDGDNVTINQVNIRNCDFGDVLQNLRYVGTVIETSGNNITIKNSKISNGKNVIRSFSSMNLLLDNCHLTNSMNFLITAGSNEYFSIKDDEVFTFVDLEGNIIKTTIKEFFKPKGRADEILNHYVNGTFNDKEKMKASLISMQEAFNYVIGDLTEYKGTMNIHDSYFSNSGIASIALEAMFNGPFLNYSSPSEIQELLGLLQSTSGLQLDQFRADNIAGVAYPVHVEITGDTRFYDYKDIENVDISGLIGENITNYAQSLAPSLSTEINIDKIFPIKTYLVKEAQANNNIYVSEGKNYINIPIAYYGGGLNLSTVSYGEGFDKTNIGKKLEVNFMENYLELSGGEGLQAMKNMLLKSVTIVSGYESFYFECIKNNGYLFNETPKDSDLISRIEEE